ncbi:MAG: hypothetical protein ACJ8DI_16565 [Ktedonobacteraceae bacterium]
MWALTGRFFVKALGKTFGRGEDAEAQRAGTHKGQYRLNKEKGGSMMERDGRPQGPSHPHPRRPRPYYTPITVALCIVGAGAYPCLFERYCPQGAPHHTSPPLPLRDRGLSA